MSNRVALGREAMRSALQLRRTLVVSREEPVNVYDVASAIGVEIRFLDAPSLEGMFLRDPQPTVCLPSLNHRPRGRVTFTCAHELGHFQLGHGTTVDEYLDGDPDGRPRSNEEFAADVFASSLLMPRQTVSQRFGLRGIQIENAIPLTLFTIACELDVGYQTLLKHLRYGLELVSAAWLDERLRITPKQIRSMMPVATDTRRLVIVDQHWPALPLDLEVDDVIAVPKDSEAIVPDLLKASGSDNRWQTYVAGKPGLGRLLLNSHSIQVRVARHGYCGLLKYRYLDEPELE